MGIIGSSGYPGRNELFVLLSLYSSTKEHSMKWLFRFYRSTIGKKIAMALTGVVLFGFVLGHLVGNLQIFWGSEILNGYAKSLHDHPTVLWPVRMGLLSALFIHIHAAITLTARSRAARPQGYKKVTRSSYATWAMRSSAVFVFVFIVYHLLHMTVGLSWLHPNFEHGKPYENLLTAFASLPVVLIYVSANLLLGMHLYHGLWSMTRTLGLGGERNDKLSKMAAGSFSLIVVVGNVLIPVAVYVGLVS